MISMRLLCPYRCCRHLGSSQILREDTNKQHEEMRQTLLHMVLNSTDQRLFSFGRQVLSVDGITPVLAEGFNKRIREF